MNGVSLFRIAIITVWCHSCFWATLLFPVTVSFVPVQRRSPRHSSLLNSQVRFLGKGPNAIVRPGSVLIAPTHEYHHYYRQSAIFVFAMGEDESETYVIRGVIIDFPTPFTLTEMIPNCGESPLGQNLLFRGGDKGGDNVVLLHNQEALGQTVIGHSGVYQGGWDNALQACHEKQASVDDFKVFFNYCEFTEAELEDLLASDEDGDAWASVEVPSQMVVSEDWDKSECWKYLRNAVAQNMMQSDT